MKNQVRVKMEKKLENLKFEKFMNSEKVNEQMRIIESEVFKKNNVKYVKVNHPKFPEMVMIERVPKLLNHLINKRFINLEKAVKMVELHRSESLIQRNPIVVNYSPIY